MVVVMQMGGGGGGGGGPGGPDGFGNFGGGGPPPQYGGNNGGNRGPAGYVLTVRNSSDDQNCGTYSPSYVAEDLLCVAFHGSYKLRLNSASAIEVTSSGSNI